MPTHTEAEKLKNKRAKRKKKIAEAKKKVGKSGIFAAMKKKKKKAKGLAGGGIVEDLSFMEKLGKGRKRPTGGSRRNKR